MSPLTLFDFPLPDLLPLLIEEAADQNHWVPFTDPKTGQKVHGWLIKRLEPEGDLTSQKICWWFKEFLYLHDADVRPRFYWQTPGTTIRYHVDRGTQCSINVVLKGQGDYIAFNDTKTRYDCALLNTQVYHGVLSPETGRLLFKLSIFDRSYAEVLDVLQSTLSCRQAVFEDLRLTDLDVRPRYSKNLARTGLGTHIDHDRIVGINFNLMDEPATIHLRGKPFEYESAVIDVGTTPHSVVPLQTERLVLKLAIRAPWATVIDRVSPWIDSVYDKTYVSALKDNEQHLVKL